MGRIYAHLDPPGYFRVDEPGFAWSWSGRKILEAYAGHAYQKQFVGTFHNPPDSDWIIPQPRQWSPDWYRNAAFASSLLDKTKWVFPATVSSSVVESEPSKVGGEAGYPANKWISIPYLPAGTTPLDATSYVNLGTAAGVSLTGFGTVAFTTTTPLGGVLAETFHPFWQVKIFPEPHNKVVLGWGKFAFLLTGSQFFMLESPNGDRQSWRLLASGAIGGDDAKTALKARSGGGALVGTTAHYAADVSLLVLPVGPADPTKSGHDVYLHFTVNGKAEKPVLVKLEYPLRDLNASWWIGANAGQHVSYQCQVVTYPDTVELPPTPIAATPYLWDLGGDYLPTMAPRLNVYSILYTLLDPSSLTVTNDGTTWTATSSYTGQQIQVQLWDESGNVWASDGTNTKGTIRVVLVSGSQIPGGRYLAPGVRRVELRFPPKLVARVTSGLVLNDTEFAGWMCETALRDTLGKQGELRFHDIETALMVAAQLDHRGSYPLHILEDADGDGVGEELRAAGWVTSPKVSVVNVEGMPKAGGGTRLNAVQMYAVEFGPLLKRADTHWVYLPQMVNPDAPYVEHGWAVQETLFQKGFDTTDSTRVHIHPDPFAGTNISRLGGGPSEQTGSGGVEEDPPYRPKLSQKALGYIEMIRDEWSGWSFYEDLTGKVWYHPDLMTELLYSIAAGTAGAKYFRAAIIHLDQATAQAAAVPKQYVLAPGFDRTFREPTANLVRVVGKASGGGTMPNVIDKAAETWTTVSDENFVGDIIPHENVSIFVNSPAAAAKVARLKLTQLKRRHVGWQETIRSAPWDVNAPVDVGKVVEVTGRGDYLISFLRVEQLARGVFRTRITGEKVPTGSTRSVVAGTYPGAGA